MNRYLLPKDDDGTGTAKRRIPIESPVGIYRIGNGTYTIVAETAEDLIDLGVKDSTVSRKTAGQPPVELAPTSRGISVRNHGSTNPITLRTKIKAQQLRIGESANVTDDCFVQVGINVELQATVEQHGGGESGSELAAAGRQNGVSPAAHAKTIADNLRNASQGSVTDARKVVDDMQTFVADHPSTMTDTNRSVRILNRSPLDWRAKPRACTIPKPSILSGRQNSSSSVTGSNSSTSGNRAQTAGGAVITSPVANFYIPRSSSSTYATVISGSRSDLAAAAMRRFTRRALSGTTHPSTSRSRSQQTRSERSPQRPRKTSFKRPKPGRSSIPESGTNSCGPSTNTSSASSTPATNFRGSPWNSWTAGRSPTG